MVGAEAADEVFAVGDMPFIGAQAGEDGACLGLVRLLVIVVLAVVVAGWLSCPGEVEVGVGDLWRALVF